MAGLGSLIPTSADIGKARNWAIAGLGLVLGASVAYWGINKLQSAGLSFPANAMMSNTWNTLPNSPYRTFRTSTRFSS